MWVAILVVVVVVIQLSYLLKLALGSAAVQSQSRVAVVTRQYSFYFFSSTATSAPSAPSLPPPTLASENTFRPVWGVSNNTIAGAESPVRFKRYKGVLLSLIMSTRNDGYGGASSQNRVKITLRALDRMAGKCEGKKKKKKKKKYFFYFLSR